MRIAHLVGDMVRLGLSPFLDTILQVFYSKMTFCRIIVFNPQMELSGVLIGQEPYQTPS